MKKDEKKSATRRKMKEESKKCARGRDTLVRYSRSIASPGNFEITHCVLSDSLIIH